MNPDIHVAFAVTTRRRVAAIEGGPGARVRHSFLQTEEQILQSVLRLGKMGLMFLWEEWLISSCFKF